MPTLKTFGSYPDFPDWVKAELDGVKGILQKYFTIDGVEGIRKLKRGGGDFCTGPENSTVRENCYQTLEEDTKCEFIFGGEIDDRGFESREELLRQAFNDGLNVDPNDYDEFGCLKNS